VRWWEGQLRPVLLGEATNLRICHPHPTSDLNVGEEYGSKRLESDQKELRFRDNYTIFRIVFDVFV